jgi:hypothetical protein
MNLPMWTEARGILHSLRKESGVCVATIHKSEVDLPLNLYPTLKEMVGKNMAVLRTDRDFRARLV